MVTVGHRGLIFMFIVRRLFFPVIGNIIFDSLERNTSSAQLVDCKKKEKKEEKEKQWSQRKHCLAKLLNQGLYFGRRKMLHPQRSLSELPKMSAASQVERAVLVSSSDRETHSDYLLKPAVSCFILTQPIACRFRDILLFSSWSQQRETILNVGEARG